MSGDQGRSQTWHRTIYSRGDQSYGHLHAAAAAGHVELALHLDADHGVMPSADEFGGWCRDVETHAAAHGVLLRPTGSASGPTS